MKVVVRMGDPVSSEALASVRQLSGLDVAVDGGGETWLRADPCEESDLGALRALPHEAVYELGSDGQLVPLGLRLPIAKLPDDLGWRSLKTSVGLAFPVAAMSGRLQSAELAGWALRPDRAGVREPNMLVTDLERLAAYVGQASNVRLRGLRFAVSGEGQVLIEGEPLPPVPGMPYWLEESLALPLGKQVALPVGPATVGQALNIEEGEIAVLHEDGTFDRVRREDFVPLTRSAVRMTQERVALGLHSEEEG